MIKHDSFIASIGRRQCVETGIVSVLIVLIVQYRTGIAELISLSIVMALLALIIPRIYYPMTIVWFGIAKILGTIMPRILLSIVFFAVVTPVGFVRRIMGKDRLKLSQFKKQRSSVMVDRDHLFTASDLDDSF